MKTLTYFCSYILHVCVVKVIKGIYYYLQTEGASRASRRLTTPSAPEARIDSDQPEEVQYAFRSRSSRRREPIPPQEATRTRTRGRPQETPEAEQERPQRNERFDARRTYSRTRNRPVEIQQKETPTTRDYVVRQRPQSFSRRTTSTEPTIEMSSPTIDETKIEVVNSNLDDIPRVTPKIENVSATTFRRRNPPSSTESTAPRRRGRVNTRIDTRPLDLSVSGTTNTFTVSNGQPSTARSAADLRDSKKLRYKTRLSETDTNLTGEGITANEVTKSSQNKESDTSQPDIQTPAPVVVKTTVEPITEAVIVKTTTSTTAKPGRRPLKRGKSNFRPTVKLSKSTKSDEIGEDDNYPASFKALIKAKNATVSIRHNG